MNWSILPQKIRIKKLKKQKEEKREKKFINITFSKSLSKIFVYECCKHKSVRV